MARKNNLRSEASASIHFDARTKTVMAEATHENIKEKVQAVREVVPGKSNNEVVLVLQYYDYNVERAIQAYLEDGAKEALTEWNFTGSKQPNKKRKNKKKTNGDKGNDKSGSTPSATSASGKGEPGVNGNVGLSNGDVGHSVNHSETDSPLDSPTAPPVNSIPDMAIASPSSTSITTTVAGKKGSEQPLPQRQANRKRSHGDSHPAHGHPNHGQDHSNRERTVSEMSTGSGMGDGHHKKGLEKAIKDLHRQTTSLERLRHLLDHEIDRSYKSVKNVFEELRKGLNDRETQLIAEMDQLKTEASEMLEMRQNRALDLKRQVDRADRLKDTQVSDLKAEIKHFVSERRHDEALGRTTRFLYDSDHMIDEMKKFGEVVHVKSMYTARRVSASSVASTMSHDGNQDDNMSQSQEVSELQDRLKNSLKLENSPSRGPNSNLHQSSTQNGSNDADFIRSKNYRRRQQNGQQSARSDKSYRGNNSVSTSLDVNSNKARISSSPPSSATSSPPSSSANDNNSSGPAAYSNTGSPGRGGRGGGQEYRGPRGGGRGRGRGGRGGGRGRGQDYRGGERSRPQSSQDPDQSRPQSGNSSKANNRPTSGNTNTNSTAS